MIYLQTKGCYRAENVLENINFLGLILLLINITENSEGLKISDFRIHEFT